MRPWSESWSRSDPWKSSYSEAPREPIPATGCLSLGRAFVAGMELRRVYEQLRTALGGEDWWRAESPWEVMVGALLVQQTTWRSVDRALRALKAEGLLVLDVLAEAPQERVEACVRPTGFYRTKARRLRRMAARVRAESGDAETYLARPVEELRESLRALEGVGEETADVILLYAANHPRGVVDVYTRRILARLGDPLPGAYQEAAGRIEAGLPRALEDHRRFHALMVELGKRYCRRTPRCGPCPLLDLCPHGQAAVGDGRTAL